jgi:hypothetical protein
MEEVDIFNSQLVYFYGHLVYFVAIRYIVWLFGTFSDVLVSCTKKNLATLENPCPKKLFSLFSPHPRISLKNTWDGANPRSPLRASADGKK